MLFRSSKFFITAFVEVLMKEFILRGIRNCVDGGRKIIQIEHVLTSSHGDSSLLKILTSLKSYSSALDFHTERQTSSDPAPWVDFLTAMESEFSVKPQFKHYVAELCKNIKTELLASEQYSTEVVNSISISKHFKLFSSN